jgi:hypothetical protein
MPSFMLRSVSEGAPARFKYSLSVITAGLASLNRELQAESLARRNAFSGQGGYPVRMSSPPQHDWYLKEWLRATGKKQKDLVKDLDWNKSKASLMVRGLQAYTKEEVNQVADYLNIRPWELLMLPEDAFALRRWRAEMIRIAHDPDLILSDEIPAGAQKKVSAA